jgi:predicted small secreted protein
MPREASAEEHRNDQPRLAHSILRRSSAENNATAMEPFLHHRVSSACQTGGQAMFQKVTTVVLLGVALAISACNTVRGAARDVNSVANCTENAMNGSQHC